MYAFAVTPNPSHSTEMSQTQIPKSSQYTCAEDRMFLIKFSTKDANVTLRDIYVNLAENSLDTLKVLAMHCKVEVPADIRKVDDEDEAATAAAVQTLAALLSQHITFEA